MNTTFPTNKVEIYKTLDFFIENFLQNYASKRNFDLGPPHSNVSKLSPFIKRRFLSEKEILETIRSKNSLNSVDKFVQEIFWRTYWRGWLEFHPKVYTEFEKNAKQYEIPKNTGIKCFDHWTEELLDTGYLHNHARMWYASIWIFTLKRSWEGGAKFFSDYLIDWCPASNTLGWRWVAGLQTIGKNYIARSENIKTFTNNKFYPENQLNETSSPIHSEINLNEQIISKIQYEEVNIKNLDRSNLGVVLTNNDMSLHKLFNKNNDHFTKCFFYMKGKSKSNLVNNFEKDLSLNVLEDIPDCEFISSFDKLVIWAKSKKIKTLIMPFETVGNKILNNENLLSRLKSQNINCIFFLRNWDKQAFPYTKKGFFPFKKKIPELLKLSGLLDYKS
mgnify:FL=1